MTTTTQPLDLDALLAGVDRETMVSAINTLADAVVAILDMKADPAALGKATELSNLLADASDRLAYAVTASSIVQVLQERLTQRAYALVEVSNLPADILEQTGGYVGRQPYHIFGERFGKPTTPFDDGPSDDDIPF